MRLSTNIRPLHIAFGFKKAIDIIAQSGFDAMDFSATIEEFHTDVHDNDYYIEMKKYANDKGLVFNQAHASFATSFEDEEKKERKI